MPAAMDHSLESTIGLATPTTSGDVFANVRDARTSDFVKRTFDVVISLSAIVVFFPILLLVALFLVLVQGRPIFVGHRRVGRSGRSFRCFKFRTMVVNADQALSEHLERDPAAQEEWTRSRKLRNDPRVTRFGRAMRTSSVDELPQLFNILRGDMSFVGPRPIVEEELSYYGVHIQKYYQVRPGLTGPWQVSGRSEVSYTTRVQLDSSYVDTRCLAGDCWIVLRTVPAVLRSRGAS